MNNMEEKLWQYIDGTCSDEERLAIAGLIEKDAAWKTAFNAMLQMENTIADMTLDEPSMAFTYKVMEAIRAQEAAKPLKTATNTYIIGAIAGFFILAIIVLITFIFTNGAANETDFQLPNISVFINSSVIKVFFYTDVILLLFLVDAFFRSKRNHNLGKSV